MRRLREGWFFALLLALLVVGTSCHATQARRSVALTAEQVDWLRAHPTIVMGSHEGVGSPPIEIVQDGELDGLGFEYLTVLAQRLGITVVQRQYKDFSALWEAVCRGEVDVLINMTFSPAYLRCLVLGSPVTATPIALVARLDDSRPSDPALRGLRLAMRRLAPEMEVAAGRYPEARVMADGTDSDALLAVAQGRADVYLGNAQVAQFLLAEQQLTNLVMLRPADMRPDMQYFAVPASKRPLIEALDRAMESLTADERADIDGRWLSPLTWRDSTTVPLSNAERDALAHNLRTAVLSAGQPLSFVDGNGAPAGLAAAYVDLLRANGALLDMVPAATYAHLVAKMQAGELDVVVGFPVDDQGQGEVPGWRYSQPFVSVPNVVVVRADNQIRLIESGDLHELRVAVAGRAALADHLRQQAPGIRLDMVQDPADGMRRVAMGEVDAYVGNLAMVEELLRTRFPGRLRVAAPVGLDFHLAVAVRSPYAPVVTTFNRVLERLGPAGQAGIRNTWLAADYRHGVQWTDVAHWGVPLAVLIIGSFLVLAIAYRRVRGEVTRRERAEGRLDEVTRTLPAVVYQLRREPEGRLWFPFIFGDTQMLFDVHREDALQNERTLFATVHPDDRLMLTKTIEEAAGSASALEVEFRTRDGACWKWIRSRASGAWASDGAVLWSGYWVDVTAARQQAEALADALAVRSEFLATMSHEIRTPMAGILGMLEVMAHEQLTGTQRAVLDTIDDSAQLLRQLLDDILDLSRLEADGVQLELQATDLRLLVNNVADVLRVSAQEKGLALVTEIRPDVGGHHHVDPMRLRQILFNLISNAIKFTHLGRVRVELGAETTPEDGSDIQRIGLRITDTGMGMTPEQQALVFLPFSQADRSISAEFGGTGLGLAICKRLVEKMGGTIRLHSVPDVGTCVDVCLPLRTVTQDGDALATAVVVPALRPDVSSMRVLVAEDQKVNQALMVWRMEQMGVPYVIADDGAQALSILQSEHIDLLVTDCRMPVMDGFALTRAIRAREAASGLPRLPILAMTASGMSDQIQQCLDAGMDEVLVKPVTSAQVQAALARWLPLVTRVTRQAEPVPLPSTDDHAAAHLDAASFWSHFEGVPDPGAAIMQFGSLESFMRLVGLAVEDARDMLDSLPEALAAGDAGRVRDHLHALAGGFGVIGASHLSQEIVEALVTMEGVGPAAMDAALRDLHGRLSGIVAMLETAVTQFGTVAGEQGGR